MSLIVDNYLQIFKANLPFFHRRLCHIVDNRESITFKIYINNEWLQEKCEYFIQYYVSRHKCHFGPDFRIRKNKQVKIATKNT